MVTSVIITQLWMQSEVYFLKSTKQTKERKPHGSSQHYLTQEKASFCEAIGPWMVAVIREDAGVRPRTCCKGATNGLLSVWLYRRSRVTHASQASHNARGQGSCSRAGCFWIRLRKQRWPLCAWCVGLCTPFPSKLAQLGQKAVPWQGLMAGWCSLLWLVHSFQVKLGKWHCVKIPSRMNVLLPQCI